MRNAKNDILFEILLKTEIQHIPYWLRITKGTVTTAILLEIILVGTLVYGLTAHVFSVISGTNLIPLFLLAAAVAVPAWLFTACRRESEAYQAATHMAYANRDRYESIVHNYMSLCGSRASSNSSSSGKLEYCPKCGYINISGSTVCMTCKTRLRR
ncbi:MAG: hypothetical protein K6A80_03310 [Saccharofermentans sp.]|nr:hypothetical protein [Saccharofermentans sp.]